MSDLEYLALCRLARDLGVELTPHEAFAERSKYLRFIDAPALRARADALEMAEKGEDDEEQPDPHSIIGRMPKETVAAF